MINTSKKLVATPREMVLYESQEKRDLRPLAIGLVTLFAAGVPSVEPTMLGAKAFTVLFHEPMSQLFENALSFNQDLSEWDISNLQDMSGIFENAPSAMEPLNLNTLCGLENFG